MHYVLRGNLGEGQQSECCRTQRKLVHGVRSVLMQQPDRSSGTTRISNAVGRTCTARANTINCESEGWSPRLERCKRRRLQALLAWITSVKQVGMPIVRGANGCQQARQKQRPRRFLDTADLHICKAPWHGAGRLVACSQAFRIALERWNRCTMFALSVSLRITMAQNKPLCR
jgi:hypothetical protein